MLCNVSVLKRYNTASTRYRRCSEDIPIDVWKDHAWNKETWTKQAMWFSTDSFSPLSLTQVPPFPTNPIFIPCISIVFLGKWVTEMYTCIIKNKGKYLGKLLINDFENWVWELGISRQDGREDIAQSYHPQDEASRKHKRFLQSVLGFRKRNITSAEFAHHSH